MAWSREKKTEWQRNYRRAFKETYGYSTEAFYATGQLREAVLERDGRKCVECGMTEAEHLAKWNRPITVDHINKNRKQNTMENLQTLCLSCHGRKDLLVRLRAQRVPVYKEEIQRRRAAGETYEDIADSLGFSIASVWKWIKRWEKEASHERLSCS